MGKKKFSGNFESKLKRLEEIAEILESEYLELEKSISLFEEGVGLSKECLNILENAELKIKVLKKDLDSVNEANLDESLE